MKSGQRPYDLIGKPVDVGHPASGRHATAMRLIAALGKPGSLHGDPRTAFRYGPAQKLVDRRDDWSSMTAFAGMSGKWGMFSDGRGADLASAFAVEIG
jgi:hypothetical protein